MCAQHAPNNPWPSLTAALYRGDAVNTLSVSVRAAERENKRLPEAEHRRGERIQSHRRLASCSRPPQFPVQFPVSHNGGRRQPSPRRKYLLNTDNTTLSHFTSSSSHSFFFYNMIPTWSTIWMHLHKHRALWQLLLFALFTSVQGKDCSHTWDSNWAHLFFCFFFNIWSTLHANGSPERQVKKLLYFWWDIF